MIVHCMKNPHQLSEMKSKTCRATKEKSIRILALQSKMASKLVIYAVNRVYKHPLAKRMKTKTSRAGVGLEVEVR